MRFFGGWDFTGKDAARPDLAHAGYTKGVPMGGDLTQAPAGKSPVFLILDAVKDPDGANLDRTQVIKGWRDTQGGLHEKIYDVAMSEDAIDGSTVQDVTYIAVTWTALVIRNSRSPGPIPISTGAPRRFITCVYWRFPRRAGRHYDAAFYGIEAVPDTKFPW